MAIHYKKYKFPNIECQTHKAFVLAVNSYIFQLICKNREQFSSHNLDHKKIHNCKGEPGMDCKLVAPIWEEKQLGVMAYTQEGIKLVEIWQKILEQNYPHLADYTEETLLYTPKITKNYNYYQTQFWAPTSNKLSFNQTTKMWYNHTKKGKIIADFNGAIQNGLKEFFIKCNVPEAITLLNDKNTFVAIEKMQETTYKSIGYNKNTTQTLFKATLKTNLKLPSGFHIGAVISYGNGYYTEKCENKKVK